MEIRMMSCNRLKSKCDGKIAGLYDLEETVGRGHYAVVKVARHVFTGEKVAVKVIDKSRLDEVSRAHLFQEVRCMKLVQHPNVVRLYEVIDTQTKLYLILELGDGGDLYDYIMKHAKGLSEVEASFYFSQIVSAIAYCHQLHVVHRDLKPENVIFFNKSETVKLTDFGFSNLFIPGHKLNTSCGSLAYSAPEILLGDSYDAPAVDVWSLGVILYMLVCGKPPFQEANDSETLIRIMDCHYVTPDHLSPLCIDLLRGMLRRDPLQRLTLTAICVHPWLSLSPRSTMPLAMPNFPVPRDSGKKTASKNLRFTPKIPLVCLGPLTEDDHSYIVQKMIDGKIAKRDEIIQSLERNAYNHVSATYYLLAERLLRKRSPLKTSSELKQPATCPVVPLSREMMVNGIISSEESPPIISNLPLSESSGVVTSNSSARRCSLIREELSEEDEDEFTQNGFGFEEVKQCRSANELSSDGDVSFEYGKLFPSSSPSAGVTVNTRLLQTVHSMPQLMLNQISEEEEEEDVSGSLSAYPQHQPASFSIAGAGNFGGCARKANRKSSTKNPVSIQSGVPSASASSLPSKPIHKPTKDAPADGISLSVEADGKPRTAFVMRRRNSCGNTDNEDSSVLVGHFCLQHEPVRQHSLVQSASDMEGLCSSCTDSSGTTNSLDRRLFQNARKDGRTGAGRSIVGAVKKSVSMLLGHLSAVGDMTSGKPRCIETWSSCSDLMQASAKLRCMDNRLSTSVNLADRHRIAGCQLARELRQNRSEREARFNDTNKIQSVSSSSSCIIRFRSRDFDTLVSKFTTGDQTTASSSRTGTS